ncbi:MAG TPA: hypothetical protein VML55_19715 [Planctomycetaceae bacterium]|nr:hypothetical protein [Planctomycetaceae bacterium]
MRSKGSITVGAACLAVGLGAALAAWAQDGDAPERMPAAEAVPPEATEASERPEPTQPAEPLTPVELPLEKRPYRVRIAFAFAAHPSLTADFRRRVLEDVRRLADRTAGQVWELTVEESRTLRPADRRGLERLDAAQLGAAPADESPQQSFFIAVRLAGARYELAARRWDRMTAQLGPIAASATFDRRDVGASAVRLVEELFRPVLAVERLDEDSGKLHLRLQAGDLAAVADDAGPLKRQVAPGDVLAPLFRYRDKQGVVQRVQFLPWTYLVVESVERSEVVCEIVAGIRVPLGASRRKSVESLAVAVRPSFAETRLTVLPQVQPARPLVGHYVTVAPKRFEKDEPMDGVLRLVTDRSGVARVPADPERALIWLYISSGSNLLARVPFVPGVEAEATIEVPDDSLRLQVEGEVAQLKGELVDTVAKRFTLLSRARLFARQKDVARVQEQMAALDALPAMAHFQQQLNVIRVPAVEAARRRNDRVALRRIERLCSETADLIRRYLDPDKARQVREEIEELRIDAGI